MHRDVLAIAPSKVYMVDRQMRRAAVRHIRARCSKCPARLHYAELPPVLNAANLPQCWGYAMAGVADEVHRYVAEHDDVCGLCPYHRKLERFTSDKVATSDIGVDLERKRELHHTLVHELSPMGTCMSCGRVPETTDPIGFQMNHRVCKRHGGSKKYSLCDFWMRRPTVSKQHRTALFMPFAEAETAMRREAELCDAYLCESCHLVVTEDQYGMCYDWRALAHDMDVRVARGVINDHINAGLRPGQVRTTERGLYIAI